MSGADRLTVEFVLVSNTVQTPIPHRPGTREIVMVINASANAVSIAVDGVASTTATSNLGPVLQSTQAFAFPLGMENHDLNSLAATGASTVVVLRQPFRPGK
jgi:hypothetical protein